MEKYLLDSSIIIEILGGSSIGLKAGELVRQGEASTSIISYCEVLNVVDLEKLSKAEAFLSQIPVFGVALSDGNTAKNLQYECRKAGKYVPTMDCLIAATAINNNSILVAADQDFERIEKLRKIVF